MIVTCLKSLFSSLKEKAQSAWSRWREQALLHSLEKGKMGVGGFLTSPLTDAEYALLKRVSGIMGTAVAVYITLMAGLKTALIVLGLCVVLSLALQQLASQGHGPGPLQP
jgi:hypothetical protein